MATFRKKPVKIEAVQWFKNGDHPEDGPASFEGKVVRYFRRPEPEYAGATLHDPCGHSWHEHGWIDTPEGGNDGAQVVCPGDWIITGVQGERYPCKPDIFAATYEPAAPAAELTPEQKLAQQIISQHGKGVPFATVVKTLEGVDGWSDLYGTEQARMVGEVDRMIGVAAVTVTWPQAAEQAGDAR